MTPSEPQESGNPLGKLVGSIGLLAIALYFTGWIYRWFYYTFFQVEPTTLNLPIETYYIASFSLLFGSFWSILRILAALGAALVVIVLCLKASAFLGMALNQPLKRIHQRLGLSSSQNHQLQLLASLFDEIIIVFWLFFVLYALARGQGIADARRDAFNETSTLPAITIAMEGDDAVIGRDLDQLLENPQDVRLLGDRARYNQLLGNELNQSATPFSWRLLSDANGSLYVFPSLNAAQARNQVPPVLVFPEGGKGDRLIILSQATHS